MQQIRIALQATDPLSQEGLASYLGTRPEFVLVPPTDVWGWPNCGSNAMT